ncbi:CENPH protein, partial [Pitta sordida]|nr:CENPH protein [Pitta sordida]
FLTLHRIPFMEALRKNMCEGGDDSRLILETLKHIVLLSQKIMKYQKFYCSPNHFLILSLLNNGTALKQARQQKLQEIRTMVKTEENKQESMKLYETKMLDRFEKESQLTTIIQNVFQSVIIGSRINWAEDPSLTAIVLQLEKNVHLQ